MTELTHDHLAEEENVRLPMDALLTGISKLIDADAYFVSERQGNEEHVAHLHHKGEPILHCGLEVDEPEAGAEGDTWLGFHYCGLQVRTGGKASTGTLGLLRREAAFTEMEKAVLQMAAARWLLQKESGLEEESLEDKRRLEAMSSANARLEKDKDQLYELGLEMITPMTGISGMAELLAETELTDEQRSYVDTIIGSSGYLIQLIQHMMANSRMAAGSVDRRITPFSLHLLLAELAAGLHDGLSQQLQLSCWLDPELPIRVVGDEELLRETLIILLSAAAFGAEPGTVGARVHVNSRSIGNDMLDLLFTIWHPHEVESRIQPISGVRDRIEGMGGELWFEHDGEGYRIRFTIQVREGEAEGEEIL
ncbi:MULTISPECIES: sensor histidine kinase [Paenibacillus]|uniref:sensor histidine kinase n=2 Tax=Paenibacillus TaxID=44249 RepID=UPI00061E777E|nr:MULTISPECIES: histidine kinase dimerization/phospho-acceptor domain-containing protein [Paenibacillus]KKC46601.1 hypothetical protein VE23_04830 [Paenibacillus sp. D9]